ncbi:hypothetical protein J6590_023412 [Homalodisca vitripennis]|nr:hypothetical protein J6590_023412 [Homalodisca vitripennis]
MPRPTSNLKRAERRLSGSSPREDWLENTLTEPGREVKLRAINSDLAGRREAVDTYSCSGGSYTVFTALPTSIAASPSSQDACGSARCRSITSSRPRLGHSAAAGRSIGLQTTLVRWSRETYRQCLPITSSHSDRLFTNSTHAPSTSHSPPHNFRPPSA